MQWAKKMQTLMTAETLPKDVAGCEIVARKHDEYNLEVSSEYTGNSVEWFMHTCEMAEVQNCACKSL